jgi:hypothetical protein
MNVESPLAVLPFHNLAEFASHMADIVKSFRAEG